MLLVLLRSLALLFLRAFQGAQSELPPLTVLVVQARQPAKRLLPPLSPVLLHDILGTFLQQGLIFPPQRRRASLLERDDERPVQFFDQFKERAAAVQVVPRQH